MKTDAAYVWTCLRPRPRDSHKGTFGAVLAVAGSASYRGAAALAVEGALRTGAGIVTLASVEPVLAAVSARLPECCLCPCEAGAEGGIAPESIPASSARRRPSFCWGRGWATRPRARPVPPRPGRWYKRSCPVLRAVPCWTPTA